MGKWIKDNLVLLGGILLPVFLIIGFFLLSNVPRALAEPPVHDFLITASRYDYQNPPTYSLSFEVRDGYLTGKAIPRDEKSQFYNLPIIKILRYRTDSNEFEELPYDLPENVKSLEQAVDLDLKGTASIPLDKRSVSPDGYRFEQQSYSNSGGLLGELFGMRRSRGNEYVLKKGGALFDLPALSADPYRYHEQRFLGWITSDQDSL